MIKAKKVKRLTTNERLAIIAMLEDRLLDESGNPALSYNDLPWPDGQPRIVHYRDKGSDAHVAGEARMANKSIAECKPSHVAGTRRSVFGVLREESKAPPEPKKLSKADVTDMFQQNVLKRLEALEEQVGLDTRALDRAILDVYHIEAYLTDKDANWRVIGARGLKNGNNGDDK